ncbi:ROK family protein, partial [Patescibacteria group bacterium]|nr:ROK family protein [Patescibacteria group bacterium]
VPTEDEKGVEGVFAGVLEAVKELGPQSLLGVGVGIAGQIDADKGLLVYSPNMPKLTHVDIKAQLNSIMKKLDLEENLAIKVDNDANAFALAEHHIGAAKDFKDVVVLTLGTGVGGGLIVDKQLYHGQSFASELGHMVVEVNGRRCSCNLLGHLEAYSSGTSIEKMYNEETGITKDALEIEKEAQADPQSQGAKVYQKAGEYLGFGLASLVNILDPEIIVLGGGIGRSDLIYQVASKICQQNIFFQDRKVNIVKSELSNDAAIIGAAMLVI